MRAEDRAAALRRSFGYWPSQAEFLSLAALHSGYFLRRQFRSFLGSVPGKPDQHLVQRLQRRKHARREKFFSKEEVLHLCSHPFYAVLGESENRHRRERSPIGIKLKVMCLDFVLSHPGVRYLATETEKLDFFAGKLGIPHACLPSKTYTSACNGSSTTRYFVDKFPLSLDERSHATFCYIDSGAVTLDGLKTYLDQYRPLLRRLEAWQVIFASDSPRNFPAAQGAFVEVFGQAAVPSLDALQEFFDLEERFQGEGWKDLCQQELRRLKGCRKRFGDIPKIQSWQQAYRREGPEALRSLARNATGFKGHFSTFYLEHDYGAFHSRV